MHKRDGFTVVELIVAIVVMGILLTIATVSYRSSQVNARDRERQADVQTIANYMEGVYSQEILGGTHGSQVLKDSGAYPYLLCGTDTMPRQDPYTECYDKSTESSSHFLMLRHLISNININALRAPGETSSLSLVSPSEDTSSYLMWDNIFYQISGTIPTASQLGTQRYFYRAENEDRTACKLGKSQSFKTNCRAFTIYYVLEGSPNTLVKLESKRR